LNGQPEKVNVIIGLGSNIYPEKNILAAISLLQTSFHEIKLASVWQSAAVGSDGKDFLNTAVLVNTSRDIKDIKHSLLLEIEHKLGRIRQKNKYADRTIDLDIIVYNNIILDPELWTQAHIAVPVAELIPDLQNPTNQETLAQASSRLMKKTRIILRPDVKY
jgi:2-amino-4-hydroxy-6-hydroxymethyldihydropteridine diphosphokinase